MGDTALDGAFDRLLKWMTPREIILLQYAWKFKNQRDARILEMTQIITGDVNNFATELTEEERTTNREFVKYLMDNKLYV